MTKKKEIKLLPGQELMTKKTVKFKSDKARNNVQPMYNEAMMSWLMSDPDPNKTLDRIKKEGQKAKALSKNNPVKLMKQVMTEQEYQDFWKDLEDLRAYYAIEYKQKKKKIKQSDLAHTYYLPQPVYNANHKYWKTLILEKRFLEHPYFCVVNPDDIEEDKVK